MANLEFNLPEKLISDLNKLENKTGEVVKRMLEAGGETALNNVKSNAPNGLKQSDFMSCVKLTRTYETPSDGAKNIKVNVSGYFQSKDGRTKPAPLVANMFEYGSSKKEYPKQPFLRKSLSQQNVGVAMEKAYKRSISQLHLSELEDMLK